VLDLYEPTYLDMMNKGGVQYGLVTTGWISVMSVNTTLLERVGMLDVIEDGRWTIEEFTEASRRVRALGDDYWGYVFFAADTGSDYWQLGFLPSFGANLYENNQATIGSPEGLKALQWYKDYADEGLAPPGAAALIERDFQVAWLTGKVLASASAPSWASPQIAINAVEAGTAEELWDAVPMAFPTTPGVDRVGVAMGPNGAMIFNNGTISQEIVDAFLAVTGYRHQAFRAATGRYASMKSLQGFRASDPYFMIGEQIIADNGLWDIGVGLRAYSAVRLLVPPMWQAIFTGELSVEDAATRFTIEANRLLSE